MGYTRQEFGLELKEKIKNKEDVVGIGDWAYEMYFEHMLEIEDDFKGFLKDLSAMADDPQFEFSYEELDQIADRLIAGERNIQLYKTAEQKSD